MAKSTATTARKLAAQYWGQPDSQKKLAEGIWMFSTPGHGGIVVDTDIRPEILKVKELSFVYTRAGSEFGYRNEQHFVALEEDCDACIAEWLYSEDIITPKYFRLYVHKEGEAFEEWKEKRLQCIKESLQMWNPEVLKVFPYPNMEGFTPSKSSNN